MLSTIELISSSSNSVRVKSLRRLSSIPLGAWSLNRHLSIGVIENNGNGFNSSNRKLINQRRIASDLAFGLSLIGIILMIIVHESSNNNFKIIEKISKINLIISTLALLLATINYHLKDLKCYMYQNNIINWQTILTRKIKFKIIFELFICSICPLPGLEWPPVDTFLSSLMFLRLYWITRCLHLHSRLSYDVAAKSIAGMNRVKTDTKFILKRTLYLYPGLALSLFVLIFWLIGGYILRLCEGNFGDENLNNYYNALWLMCVTFLTIGYGDLYPITVCGRFMSILTGVIGVCVASMIVAVISQKISLSHAEERVHNFMARTKHARSLKITAAQVLKECWLLYKIKHINDQEKVIHHQRRLSSAICTLRRLRKEQRILQEENGGVSIDDVAKISQNATEIVKGIGQSQQNLNERVNAIEYRLEEIHKGIDNLTELILKRKNFTNNLMEISGN
ncbi:CaMBD domain-containing protein [Meloidogyne graminicola]|uniref:CaMBD domain-containing protein n=1 Tax=Meloidogyne graminicola TaxID=189291 RepID=A0A8S9ZGK7_9BILA|nr:CaMBD domain-containing protein [Meloidogyne graminicola]